MTKTKGREKKRKKRESQVPQNHTEQPRKFTWIPLWGWILIFLVPLIFSEFMFYVAGRIASMVIFPIVWTGFWVALMKRSGWPILKKKR